MRNLVLLASSLASLALAAPPFVVQQQAPTIPESDAGPTSPSLGVDDFLSIQSHIAHALSPATHSPIINLIEPTTASADLHHPPAVVDLSQWTILEILSYSLHEPKAWPHLPLHRLGWLVNRSSEAQEALAKKDITLLAPDDAALTPPHHRTGGHASADEAEAVWDEAQVEADEQPQPHPFYTALEDVEESVTEWNRTAVFSRIIGWVLKYHTLPTAQSACSLASHSTIPTTLLASSDALRIHVDRSWALHPHPYPTIKFNFYATKRGVSIKAKNGLIHLISAPLLPPLSPLNKLFLFPQAFATLTSGVQKVGLADALLPAPYHHRSEDLWEDVMAEVLGNATKGPYTLFAPTNFAFSKLGARNLALLHSPFPLARRILKAVLSYHVVPDIAFYSDYIHNASSLAAFVTATTIDADVDVSHLISRDDILFGNEVDADLRIANERALNVVEEPLHAVDLPKIPLPKIPIPDLPAHPRPPHHPPTHKANVTSYALPTLLTNATLHVDVVSFRLWGKGPVRSVVIVKPALADGEGARIEGGRKVCPHHKKEGARPVKVWKKDVPARNGAVHIVNDVLRPPYHHSKHALGATEGYERLLEAFFV